MKTRTQWTVPLKPKFKHGSRPHPAVLSLVALLLLQSALWAASYSVQMTGALTFSPDTLTVGQGDSVTWTNISGFAHTSTSGNAPNSNGLWGSGTVNPATSFTVTFTNTPSGSYPYFCSFHYFEGMTGTLTVTNAAGQAPLLSDPSWRNNQFQFTLNGTVGQSYITERSSNLANWIPVSTNVAASSRLTITDPTASNDSGFYRVRQGP